MIDTRITHLDAYVYGYWAEGMDAFDETLKKDSVFDYPEVIVFEALALKYKEGVKQIGKPFQPYAYEVTLPFKTIPEAFIVFAIVFKYKNHDLFENDLKRNPWVANSDFTLNLIVSYSDENIVQFDDFDGGIL